MGATGSYDRLPNVILAIADKALLREDVGPHISYCGEYSRFTFGTVLNSIVFPDCFLGPDEAYIVA